MFKNVASQKVALFAFNITTGAAKTGDSAHITGSVVKDWGARAALGTPGPAEIDATNCPGWYQFTLTQAETNADALLFTAISSTGSISVVGAQIFTTPASFSSFVTPTGATVATVTNPVAVTSNIKQNTGSQRLSFTMTDSTNHNPSPGLTVTATVSIDGAGFAACANSVTAISNGDYTLVLNAADTNGKTLLFRFTAAASDDLNIMVITQP